MSADAHKDLYRRFIEEVVNSHNLNRLEAFLRSDVIEHGPGVPSGVGSARQYTAAYFVVFPDLHVSIDDLIAEGDMVVARLTATATDHGVFNGIPPTGKRCFVDQIRVRSITKTFRAGLDPKPQGKGAGAVRVRTGKKCRPSMAEK
jgi:predicted ester cyclase